MDLAFIIMLSAIGAEKEDKLDQEIKVLLANLKTEELKKHVKLHGNILKAEETTSEQRGEAIRFFYDLKAKGILMGILHSPKWEGKSQVRGECLDLFGIEDVLILYEAALAHAEPLLARADSGEIGGGETLTIKILARRSATLLGLGPMYPTLILPHSAENIRAWWLKALGTAKNQGTCPSPLDKAIKYLETQKEKTKEP